jgi:hypothetical protein
VGLGFTRLPARGVRRDALEARDIPAMQPHFDLAEAARALRAPQRIDQDRRGGTAAAEHRERD